MLETTLGASAEDYTACKREATRLFKRVHFEAGRFVGRSGMGSPPSRFRRPFGGIFQYFLFYLEGPATRHSLCPCD